MTSSTHSTRRIWKRLFRPLTIALAACALAGPTPALASGPVSEKTAGLSPDVSTVIVSEKLAGRAGADVVLQGDDKVIAPNPAVVLHGDDKVIDRTPGAALHPDSRARRPGPSVADYRLRPVEVVTASDRRFDWADAGIASALTLASILGAAGAALTIRRRRGSLAH